MDRVQREDHRAEVCSGLFDDVVVGQRPGEQGCELGGLDQVAAMAEIGDRPAGEVVCLCEMVVLEHLDAMGVRHVLVE